MGCRCLLDPSTISAVLQEIQLDVFEWLEPLFQPRFQDATKVASRSDMDDPPVITSKIFKPAVPKHL
jgi:hypothetical protein